MFLSWAKRPTPTPDRGLPRLGRDGGPAPPLVPGAVAGARRGGGGRGGALRPGQRQHEEQEKGGGFHASTGRTASLRLRLRLGASEPLLPPDGGGGAAPARLPRGPGRAAPQAEKSVGRWPSPGAGSGGGGGGRKRRLAKLVPLSDARAERLRVRRQARGASELLRQALLHWLVRSAELTATRCQWRCL